MVNNSEIVINGRPLTSQATIIYDSSTCESLSIAGLAPAQGHEERGDRKEATQGGTYNFSHLNQKKNKYNVVT